MLLYKFWKQMETKEKSFDMLPTKNENNKIIYKNT